MRNRYDPRGNFCSKWYEGQVWKSSGGRVENKIFTNLFNSRTFLVSPWKSLSKLDARFKFFRGFPSLPRRNFPFRLIIAEPSPLDQTPSSLSLFLLSHFSGHDLSPRFRHKISWLAKYVELFGGFSMGRKTGRLWAARVQKERRVRTVRRYEEVSR